MAENLPTDAPMIDLEVIRNVLGDKDMMILLQQTQIKKLQQDLAAATAPKQANTPAA